MAENLITLETVSERVKLKRTKIYSMVKNGEFPAPIKLGSASRWRESTVDRWVVEREATL